MVSLAIKFMIFSVIHNGITLQYYYKQSDETYDIYYGPRKFWGYKEVKSPKSYKQNFAERGERPGICINGDFTCTEPYRADQTEVFKCNVDYQCPRYFKCCEPPCFQHKVCQPSGEECRTSPSTTSIFAESSTNSSSKVTDTIKTTVPITISSTISESTTTVTAEYETSSKEPLTTKTESLSTDTPTASSDIYSTQASSFTRSQSTSIQENETEITDITSDDEDITFSGDHELTTSDTSAATHSKSSTVTLVDDTTITLDTITELPPAEKFLSTLTTESSTTDTESEKASTMESTTFVPQVSDTQQHTTHSKPTRIPPANLIKTTKRIDGSSTVKLLKPSTELTNEFLQTTKIFQLPLTDTSVSTINTLSSEEQKETEITSTGDDEDFSYSGDHELTLPYRPPTAAFTETTQPVSRTTEAISTMVPIILTTTVSEPSRTTKYFEEISTASVENLQRTTKSLIDETDETMLSQKTTTFYIDKTTELTTKLPLETATDFKTVSTANKETEIANTSDYEDFGFSGDHELTLPYESSTIRFTEIIKSESRSVETIPTTVPTVLTTETSRASENSEEESTGSALPGSSLKQHSTSVKNFQRTTKDFVDETLLSGKSSTFNVDRSTELATQLPLESVTDFKTTSTSDDDFTFSEDYKLTNFTTPFTGTTRVILSTMIPAVLNTRTTKNIEETLNTLISLETGTQSEGVSTEGLSGATTNALLSSSISTVDHELASDTVSSISDKTSTATGFEPSVSPSQTIPRTKGLEISKTTKNLVVSTIQESSQPPINLLSSTERLVGTSNVEAGLKRSSDSIRKATEVTTQLSIEITEKSERASTYQPVVFITTLSSKQSKDETTNRKRVEKASTANYFDTFTNSIVITETTNDDEDLVSSGDRETDWYDVNTTLIEPR